MTTKKLYNRLFLMLISGFTIACSDSETESEVIEVKPEGIVYEESLEIFSNPERGFYDHTEAHNPDDVLTPGEVNSLKSDNISLITRVYYLSDFKDQPINNAMLETINLDLNIVREAGIKAILRFAYTNEINGEDATVERVGEHIEQLGPVLNANQDVIAFIQAGFIGPWGEWHNSSNNLTTVENERKILFKLLEVLSSNILVQVRTPGAKQKIFETVEPLDESLGYTQDYQARVGHHNDCFMAGVDDYGTYEDVEVEKAYINREALYVPTGGETCPPQGDYPNCSYARNEMEHLRWTYLNRDYYIPVMRNWNDMGCLDEFKRNLGYRFVLLNANFPDEVKPNEIYNIEINLANRGFAPVYKTKVTNLVFKDQLTGEQYSFKLGFDLRKVKPSETFIIDEDVKLSEIPAGNYSLHLEITDEAEDLQNRVPYKIRLANVDTWDSKNGLNNLKYTVNITP